MPLRLIDTCDVLFLILSHTLVITTTYQKRLIGVGANK